MKKAPDTSPPPPLPWKKGVTPHYRSFVVEVQICQDNDGNIYSIHNIQSDEDQQTAATLPSAGIEQVAYGLLCEAIRREAFLEVAVKASKQRGYLADYVEGNPEKRHEIEADLSRTVVEMCQKSVIMMAPAAAREILHMLETNPAIPKDRPESTVAE